MTLTIDQRGRYTFVATTRWGTTYTDQCPLALAARMYRAEWKAMHHRNTAPVIVEPKPQKQPRISARDSRRLVLLWEIKRLVNSQIAEIMRAEFMDGLMRRAWPNLQPRITHGLSGNSGGWNGIDDGFTRAWEDRADLDWSHI